MILNEKQILETAENIRNGSASRNSLKELLGGERLDTIFDQETQEAMFNNIIEQGKLHNMTLNGNGLDILDGLLNNKVNSDLSDFYMIKPDYILQLPPDQQKNMADSISGGRQDLSLALQNLWSKGIRTEACTTKSSDNIPMLQLNIKENEFEKQDFVQQLYEQNNISGNYFYDYQAKDFHINLSGTNLYEYLQARDLPPSQMEKSNIFEDAIKDSLAFAEEMYTSYSQNGMDTTALQNEILSEKRSLEELSSRSQQKTSQTQTTERKSWELDPAEKARIIAETDQIVKRFQEQQQQQSQQQMQQQQVPPQTMQQEQR